MDELLRAYAKQRREQAGPPPALHPVARKLLQDEMRRNLRDGAGAVGPDRVGRLAGRALAACGRGRRGGGPFVVVTVLFAPSWNQSYAPRHSMLSAPATKSAPPLANRSETAVTPEADKIVAPVSVTPPPELSQASNKSPAPEADRIAEPGLEAANGTVAPANPALPMEPSLASRNPSASEAGQINQFGNPVANSPAPAAMPASAAPFAERSLAPQNPSASVAGAIPPPPAAARPMERTAKAPAPALPLEGSDGAVAAQNFVQINAGSRSHALKQGESNVLSSFQMERVGANVRIIDADGSVYQGEVLGSRAGRGGVARGGAAKAPAPASKDSNENESWAFKVSGTNKNLQQNVVFTGNVLDLPERVTAPAAPPAGAAVQGAVQNRNAPQAQNASNAQNAPIGQISQNAQNASNLRRFSRAQNSQSQSAQNSLITGKVKVGGGKEFKIEARPSDP